MKKCLIVILFMVIMIGNVSAQTSSIDEREGFEKIKNKLCPHASEYSNIVFPYVGKIDDVEIYSYCQFQNQSEALKNVVNRFYDVFEYIKEKYNLYNINNDNWEEYSLYTHTDDNKENSVAYTFINAFFDVYENYDDNDELKKLINIHNTSLKSDSSAIKKDIDARLQLMLPDYNNVIVSQELVAERAMNSQTFYRSIGVQYATSTAYFPDIYGYGYFPNGDCTNFVSQILLNGGYNQVWGINQFFGWWYNRKNDGTFSYSRSWTYAPKFASYWGIYDYWTNFYVFSTNVKVGDFIALDEDNDGSYNHMGFVTELSNNYHWNNYKILDGITGYVSFRDFKIAQHTSNYHLYVSDDGNGWELYDLVGARFGIIDIDQ